MAAAVADKTKEWELEMLMEKLRAKSGQFKTFFESAKALRMALLVILQKNILSMQIITNLSLK